MMLAKAQARSSRLFILGLLLCLLCCASSASAYATGLTNERRETNAERLARGLSPLQPQNLRRGSGTLSARRSLVSPLPPVTVTGRLEVRIQSSGSSVGFVRNWEGSSPISGLNFLSGFEPDLEVSITYPPASPHRLDVLTTNPRFEAPFFVGGSGGTLVPGVRSILAFTNVNQTPPGSTPGGGATGGESAIWSFDPASRKLQATWVNPDGSTVPAILVVQLRANALFFVSDVDAYNAAVTFPASAVDLYLVDV